MVLKKREELKYICATVAEEGMKSCDKMEKVWGLCVLGFFVCFYLRIYELSLHKDF